MALIVEDMLVLVLRVLPGKLPEWLNVERYLPGKRKDEAGMSEPAPEVPGSG